MIDETRLLAKHGPDPIILYNNATMLCEWDEYIWTISYKEKACFIK